MTKSPHKSPSRMPKVVRDFLDTEEAGAVVLLAATVVALGWANSPWQDSYRDLWATVLTIGVGDWNLSTDLRHWINDGLMAVFFFVVGLEIKRELVTGDLRDPRTAAVPVVAALGGMVVPALVYAAFTAGGDASRGWGIPMATDIAFALGVVALLGRRVPSSLKVFLLALAIVDDVGAILMIAVFYATGIDTTALGAAAVVVGGLLLLRAARVTYLPAYVGLAALLWLALYQSGVHATIAGVALGLLAPVAGPRRSAVLVERVERGLHPWSSFAIVPLFALANAGVTVSSTVFEAPDAGTAALGIGFGLVAGKTLGITGATWIAVRTGLGRMPPSSTWSQVFGVAAVAGIGFTVSLFIAGLAFAPGAALESGAKIGILIGSLIAGVLGSTVLFVGGRPRRRRRKKGRGAKPSRSSRSTPPARRQP